jgi:hypothetical protein
MPASGLNGVVSKAILPIPRSRPWGCSIPAPDKVLYLLPKALSGGRASRQATARLARGTRPPRTRPVRRVVEGRLTPESFVDILMNQRNLVLGKNIPEEN